MRNKEQKNITEQNGGEKQMTLEEALNLSNENFEKLAENCKNFNFESYNNHSVRNEGETFGEFLSKGSRRIRDESIVKTIVKKV